MDSKHFTFFVDEAGHTGRNRTDINQPFLLMGGPIVPDASYSKLTPILLEHLKTHGIDFTQNPPKGRKLYKNSRGRKRMADTLALCLAHGCQFRIVIHEKRFGLATLITEMLVHPYGPDAFPTEMSTMRRAWANAICELMTDVEFSALAGTYGSGNKIEFEKQMVPFLKRLDNVSDDMLQMLALAFDTDADADFFLNGDNFVNAPNSSVLYTIMNFGDRVCHSNKFSGWQLTLDRIFEYEIEIQKLFEQIQASTDSIKKLDNGLEIRFGATHLREVRFADEIEDRAIMTVADWFVSSINCWFADPSGDDELSKVISELCRSDGAFYTISRVTADRAGLKW